MVAFPFVHSFVCSSAPPSAHNQMGKFRFINICPLHERMTFQEYLFGLRSVSSIYTLPHFIVPSAAVQLILFILRCFFHFLFI